MRVYFFYFLEELEMCLIFFMGGGGGGRDRDMGEKRDEEAHFQLFQKIRKIHAHFN